jgi:murein DD-endopeptidase MepM/ murein hydrolase activator NlpD
LIKVGLPICMAATLTVAGTALYPSGGIANPQPSFVIADGESGQAYYMLPLPGKQTVSPRVPLTQEPVSAVVPSSTTTPADDDPATLIALAQPQLERLPDAGPPSRVHAPGQWREEEVGRGDTLSSVFDRLGLPQATMYRLLKAEGLGDEFKRMRPGDRIRVRVEDARLLELAYASGPLSTLVISLDDKGWMARHVATPTELRSRFVGGVIEQSLYLSAIESGLDDRLIMELVSIFGWDVDFALDIRAGDRFGLIHEEIYAEDGTKLADGAILAASFTNQGKTFQAVRYADASGTPNFFAPDGYSMRKAFLRSPVDFRRISSRFRGSRYHPVLGVKRPHRGVDYAASRGTPVKASGDGKVVHAARKGGYGKTVILQHGGRYRTLYAHLNGYASGIKSGTRVRQGQTIGYVGATGLATGPHLHYEFLVDGVHRNPLTVDLPKADPLDKKLLPDFRAVAEPLIAQLAVHEQTLVAQNAQ